MQPKHLLPMQIGQKDDKITEENVMDILHEEIGLVFNEVLQDAGVYKCTAEGREAFERFINKVNA